MRTVPSPPWPLAAAAALLAACVGDLTAHGGDDAAASAPPADATAPGADAAPRPGGDAAPVGPTRRWRCDDEPPLGAQLPPPPPAYGGGACPALVPGRNVIVSSGAARAFHLVVPDAIDAAERLPLAFLWHPLGSDATVYLERGELEAAIQSERFVAVLPESKGDLSLRWPFTVLDSDARIQEELRFFDDVFACVAAALPVNLSCVTSGGVSAGGLWASQLAWRRGQYLASFMSLSGGTGDGIIKDWQSSPHKMPGFVLWGGPGDQCAVLELQSTSRDLEENLAADGHFVVECIHNCGHAVPPFAPVPGGSVFEPIWDFGLNHPYWLPDGDSPYLQDGLPPSFPSWCGIGVGSATPRTGACADPSQC